LAQPVAVLSTARLASTRPAPCWNTENASVPFDFTEGLAAAISRHFTPSGVSAGFACSIRATMPEVTPAACEVPVISSSPPCFGICAPKAVTSAEVVGIAAAIWPPGAITSGFTKPSCVGPAAENEATRSSARLVGV